MEKTFKGSGFTRRSFVKGAAALGAAAAVSGNGIDFAYADGVVDPSAPVEKRFTYCDMCNQVPQCGMTVYVQDGYVVRAESRDPHPVTPICAKGLASIQELYDPARLTKPLRRTNEKGTGKSTWEEISWDEAYAEIAAQFNRVKAEHGPDAVLFYVGDPKEPRGAVQRVATLFGSSSYGLESSLCATACQMASQLVYGKGQITMGVDPTEDTAS